MGKVATLGVFVAGILSGCVENNGIDQADTTDLNQDSLGKGFFTDDTLASSEWQCGTQKILFDGQCRVAAYFENFVSDGFELALVTKTEPNEDNGFVLWEQTSNGLQFNVVSIVPESAVSTKMGRNGYRVTAIDKTVTTFNASEAYPYWSIAISSYQTGRNISATHYLYEKYTSYSRTCESSDLATLEDAGNCMSTYYEGSGFCANGAEILETWADLYCDVAGTLGGGLVGAAAALSTGGTVPIGVGVGAAVAVALRGICHTVVDLAASYGGFESAAQTFCEDTSDSGEDHIGIDLGSGPVTLEDFPIGDAGDQCSQLSGQKFEFEQEYAFDDGEGTTVVSECTVVEASNCETENNGTCTCNFTPVSGETCDGSNYPTIGDD